MSFSQYFDDEPERFSDYAFKENPNIKTFEEFSDAMRRAFNTKNGENTGMTNEDLIHLFESKEVKDRIKENTTSKEYDQAYGDGVDVEYIAHKKSVQRIEIPKIKVIGYKKGDKTVKPYSRTKPSKYTPAQEKFIAVRKKRGDKPKKIYSDYNKAYPNNPKTYNSIRSKTYRV